METQFITFRISDDGTEYLDEIIGADLDDALTSVIEHDGMCRVLRVDYDEDGQVECSRIVTSDIIDLLKDAYEGGPAHPLIAEWADREEAEMLEELVGWQRHCAAEMQRAI